MKFLHFKRPDTRTIRLALTYLIIIMVMSGVFSIVLYQTSVSRLKFYVHPPAGTAASATLSLSVTNSTNSHIGKTTNPAQQLQQDITGIERDLLSNLIGLNVLVLVLGSGFSYYLARRTLRPIEAVMETQSRFASDASHELRTPLTVMQAENESALRTLELSERARAVFTSNLEEITRLKELSEGLLQLARENEESALQPVWLDEIANLAKNNVIKLAQSRDITISNASPHEQVLANKQSLMQVLVILLDNAITYGPRGVTVHIEGYITKNHAHLNVRDEGPGIGSDDLEHIFDRFYRAEQSHKQHPTGHGLGLSIAHKLVTQQHGTITVESTSGKGSTFTINLPIVRRK